MTKRNPNGFQRAMKAGFDEGTSRKGAQERQDAAAEREQREATRRSQVAKAKIAAAHARWKQERGMQTPEISPIRTTR